MLKFDDDKREVMRKVVEGNARTYIDQMYPGKLVLTKADTAEIAAQFAMNYAELVANIAAEDLAAQEHAQEGDS